MKVDGHSLIQINNLNFLNIKCETFFVCIFDEGSPTNPVNFLGQDYQKLLQKSLRRNELYTDELFPPNSSSIDSFHVTSHPYRNAHLAGKTKLCSIDRQLFLGSLH